MEFLQQMAFRLLECITEPTILLKNGGDVSWMFGFAKSISCIASREVGEESMEAARTCRLIYKDLGKTVQ